MKPLASRKIAIGAFDAEIGTILVVVAKDVRSVVGEAYAQGGPATVVSRVDVPGMRRLALVHGLLSFLFNTVILALSINLASGLV